MEKLIGFEDDEALNPAVVGQKFAALSYAFRKGFSVPPAAVIPTSAHIDYIRTGTWSDDLEKIPAPNPLYGALGRGTRRSAVHA